MISQKLIDSGLFAKRMVNVDGPLVDLYNRCLIELGFTPTNLTSFRIDGYGWSPEIAQEQDNNAYLSHGEANPFAIILSPLQAGLPVFYPYHNFDRKMMGFVYEDFHAQIEEITKTTAIMVDIDRFVKFLESPMSLLKYKKITIKCKILGNLLEGKQDQDHLIAELMTDENFLSERSQQKLVANIKQYGDLRTAKIDMEPQSYDVTSFSIRMFGGIFIFREEFNELPLMVYVDKTMMKKSVNDPCVQFHIHDKKLIQTMLDKNYLIVNEDSTVLERMKDWAFVSAIMDKPRDHSITEIMNNKGIFMKYLQKYKEDLKLYRALDAGNFDGEHVAQFAPHQNLSTTQYRLLWKLLTTIKYYDVFLLYKWNKEKFYKEFNEYKDDVQDWVVKHVVYWNKQYYKQNDNGD